MREETEVVTCIAKETNHANMDAGISKRTIVQEKLVRESKLTAKTHQQQVEFDRLIQDFYTTISTLSLQPGH